MIDQPNAVILFVFFLSLSPFFMHLRRWINPFVDYRYRCRSMDGSQGSASPQLNTNHVLAKSKAYQTDTIRYNYRSAEKVHCIASPTIYS